MGIAERYMEYRSKLALLKKREAAKKKEGAKPAFGRPAFGMARQKVLEGAKKGADGKMRLAGTAEIRTAEDFKRASEFSRKVQAEKESSNSYFSEYEVTIPAMLRKIAEEEEKAERETGRSTSGRPISRANEPKELLEAMERGEYPSFKWILGLMRGLAKEERTGERVLNPDEMKLLIRLNESDVEPTLRKIREVLG